MDGILGYITLFAGSFAPTNWTFCNGQQMQTSDNTPLFALLGYNFGGSGSVFNLPDLRGRFAAGVEPGFIGPDYTLGSSGGAEQVVLTPDMINHVHSISAQAVIPCNNSVGNLTSPLGNVYGVDSSGQAAYSNTQNGNFAGMGFNMQTDSYGAAKPTPMPTRAAGLALNFIICVSGLYPNFQGSEEMG